MVVNGRDGDAVDATVDAITGAGGRSRRALSGSAADESVAEALIALCENEFGAVDALVNCAGTAEPPGSSILDGQQTRSSATSSTSTWARCSPPAAPPPRGWWPQAAASIVNTSSFAFLGDYGGTGYPAGKGAVNGLTMAIAAELAEHGVRANVVCPGAKTRLSTGAGLRGAHRRTAPARACSTMSARRPHSTLPRRSTPHRFTPTWSATSAGVTGQIFIAAGGFVGRFDRPTPSVLGYRDHRDAPPWTPAEIDAMLRRRQPLSWAVWLRSSP